MTTEKLIQGLIEITEGKIRYEAMIDMAPQLIAKLRLLIMNDYNLPLMGDDHVYIAGKISGLRYEEANRMFTDAEQKLRGAGYKTVNPMRLVPETASWNQSMRTCISTMATSCDKIFMIDNWQDSRGASIEKQLAKDLEFSEVIIPFKLKTAI